MVVALALFTAPGWLGQGAFLAGDNGRMHLPVKRFLAKELRAGRLPTWNPYLGLGAPVIGAAVDAPQHPLTLLLLVLPVGQAIDVWVVAALAAAALGAWWWARTLGASREAALVAGLGFALAGPVVSATDNLTYLTALATLPALFAAAHRWTARGGAAQLAALGGISYLLAAAGDAQSWGLALLLLPVLGVSLGEGGTARARLARSLVGVGACAVAAAPAILPLLAWLPYSSRAGAVDLLAQRRWSLAPIRLLELGVPHLLRGAVGEKVSPLFQALAEPESLAPWALSVYLGATVLPLALVGAWTDRRARVLLACGAICLWMALGGHGGFGQLAVRLPVLRGFRYWEKLAPWAALMLAGAAGIGVDRLAGAPRVARRLAAACGVTVALALAGPFLTSSLGGSLPPHLRDELSTNLRDGFLHLGAFTAALAVLLLAGARERIKAPALLAALVALDLAAANVRAYELQAPWVALPQARLADWLRSQAGLQRVLTPFEPMVKLPGLTAGEASNLLGARTVSAAWNVGYGIGNFDTYTGAVPARVAEIDGLLSPNRLLPNVGLWGIGHVVIPGRMEQAGSVGLRPPYQVEAEDQALPAWLMAVTHRPRAYLAARVKAVQPDEARAFVLDPGAVTSEVTVVEGAPPGALDGVGAAGRAVVEVESSAQLRVETASPVWALLVLNDAWAPGWSARIDGQPVSILRANYLVRGVVVPPGDHRVTFEYRAPGLVAGWGLLLAGAFALLGWAWWARRRREGTASAGTPRGGPGPA